MQQTTKLLRRIASIAAAVSAMLFLTGVRSEAGIGMTQKAALTGSSIVHADGTREQVTQGNDNDGDDNGNGSGNDNDGDDNGTGSGNDNDGDDNGNGSGNDNDGDDHGTDPITTTTEMSTGTDPVMAMATMITTMIMITMTE